MQVSNVITISREEPGYKEALHYCWEHLRIRNPEYQKKRTMGLYLGDTPEKLYLYERKGENLILPYGTLKDLLNLHVEFNVQNRFNSDKQVDYSCHIPLFPYQDEAVKIMVERYYGILQSPAGSGKTQIGLGIIAAFKRRALWLCAKKDLLTQSMNRAKQYIREELIGTITEGKVNIGEGITFATVQTMCRLDLSQYRDEWDVIIVDECHRAAGSPTAVTQFYKVLNSLSARHKYGLSATVHRADGMIAATYALLGDIAHTVPESAVAKRIMKVGVKPCQTGVKITRECLNTDGTLNYTKLISYLCENKPRNSYIGFQIVLNAEYPSLILSDRLEHLGSIMATLPKQLREQAVMVSGKTKKAVREQAMEDMRQGKKKYLFATYSLAKEGLDIPCLERLYLTTPQKDYTVITQSIGRIARTCEGKQNPVCYDFVDDAGYLVKAYKKRCTTYRKNGCYFIND